MTRHPDDSTLFDLVEGTLDPARAEAVDVHLSRCAACAAFVRAARAGGPAAHDAIETMPEQAAIALHAAVTGAWRERVAGIASAEARADAEAEVGAGAGADARGEFAGFAPGAAGPATTELRPDAVREADAGSGAARESVRATPRRRGRRLVPVLAFVVLGTLAGTSIYIGEQAGDQATTTQQEERQAPVDEPAAGEVTTEDAGAPAAPAMAPEGGSAGGSATSGELAEAPADADSATGVDRSATSGATGASTDTAVTGVPPTGSDDFVDQERVCIATLDETQLALPEGRIPTQITRGPFGVYLVCG